MERSLCHDSAFDPLHCAGRSHADPVVRDGVFVCGAEPDSLSPSTMRFIRCWRGHASSILFHQHIHHANAPRSLCPFCTQDSSSVLLELDSLSLPTCDSTAMTLLCCARKIPWLMSLPLRRSPLSPGPCSPTRTSRSVAKWPRVPVLRVSSRVRLSARHHRFLSTRHSPRMECSQTSCPETSYMDRTSLGTPRRSAPASSTRQYNEVAVFHSVLI
ncbi:hypothetical protein VTK73DRAFT_2156 [Phialemonium thermophilum]|uniref:Uncharacterized protein n=1 Tax=Phialemonium thermophilum TaxID=223376 RepID=A0ABR3VSI0_9PEZI